MRRVCLVFLLIISTCSLAKPFNVVTGIDRPPYSLQGAKTGFEIELLSAVLDKVVNKHEFVIAPYGRSIKILDVRNIDAMTTASVALYRESGKLSMPYIQYQNVAVTLKSTDLKLGSINDLERFSIATFLNAKTILGDTFNQAVSKSSQYTELSDQSLQLHMLRKNKVQVLVMDINIFNYFNKFHELEVDIHRIFPLTAYGLLIKENAFKTRFDHALQQYLNSDAYLSLANKWSIDPNLLIKQ
ncbi:substrate-binding periplasmic protein [Pseudoalteromonas sp. SS15]|uniref:substrate-binding periplasmic protein n=1 Tax=Pseudoalteromonas sp. SS15 TaxID=3139393 RepID=UPI003BAABDB5